MIQISGRQIKNFLLGESFQMALRYTIGSFLPLLICLALDEQTLGFELTLGAIIVCGADKRDPVKIKIKIMLATVGLATFVSLVVHFAAYQYYALLVLIFILIFLFTFVAPFGNRHANTAFMGNMAIIIALSTYKAYTIPSDIIHHVLLLLAGSIWYTVFALVISLVSTPYQLKQSVSKCMEQTVSYLQQRVQLFNSQEDLGAGLIQLSEKHAELTLTQVGLRDFLFQRTTPLRKKNSHERRMLLLFTELLDIQEAALATPIDYQSWHQWLQKYPELNQVPEISTLMVDELENLYNQYFHGETKTSSLIQLVKEKMEAELMMLETQKKQSNQSEDQQLAYSRAYRIRMYQEIQLNKLESLRQIMNGAYNQTSIYLDDTTYHQFANEPEISWSSIKSNLNLNSSYFRFALRTTITAMAGFLLGSLLGFQNPYWVLLTILVILKPGYSLARQRLVHRILGTVSGAIIAYGLYLLQPSAEISLTIFAASFFLGYCFALSVYAVTSLFFTIYVIFLYSFLQKEIAISVLFRVVDTTMGAGLCWLAMHYLLPSWEYNSFPIHLKKSLRSCFVFFNKVSAKAENKDLTITEYRLARKEATINLANLVASYQRVKGEPAKMQKNAAEYGNLILLFTAVLSVISSIGLYISDFPVLKKLGSSTKKEFDKTSYCMDLLLKQIEGLKEDFPKSLEQLEKINADSIDKDEELYPEEDAFLHEELKHLNGLLLRIKNQIDSIPKFIS